MSNALVPANADITATLRKLGMMDQESTSDYNRAKINGTTFEMGEDVFPSNQVKKTPAFIGRLLEMPVEYQGVYLTQDEADQIGRPDIGDKFCKSHYDASKFPNEAGKYAEDGTECRQCPINPFIKRDASPLDGGKKCAWRGDVLFQRCEADGTTLDPRPWTLSLSTTGMIELKGMRKDPEKGYISDLNFTQKLARLGITAYPELGAEEAIGKIAMALAMGGVIAEFRLVQAQSSNGARSFPVVQLDPIGVVEVDTAFKNLEAGPKNVTPVGDDAEDLPF